MADYREIVTNTMVRDAVKTTITTMVGAKRRAEVYLDTLAVATGRGDLPDFRSVISSNENPERWDEDQLPACLVIVPGLAEQPEKHGSKWKARWAVGIGCVVSAKTREDTLDLCGIYTAAVRALLLQNASLGGVSDGIDWVGERYDELPTEDSRTIAAGQSLFVVDVLGVVDSLGGPTDPITIQSHLETVNAL